MCVSKDIIYMYVKEILGKSFTCTHIVSARNIKGIFYNVSFRLFLETFLCSICVSVGQRNIFHVIVAVSAENI
jgi:hypothetical protein